MILDIKVIPGAKEEHIEQVSNNTYRISIKERAEKGKANAALIKLLARHFNVPQQNITLKNPASRKKMIEIKEKKCFYSLQKRIFHG